MPAESRRALKVSVFPLADRKDLSEKKDPSCVPVPPWCCSIIATQVRVGPCSSPYFPKAYRDWQGYREIGTLIHLLIGM